MATGTTLCVCNRMTGSQAVVYDSLGLKEGKHLVMFDSLAEFVEVVTNYTTRPEYEARRLLIVKRAQELAVRKFSWDHVAERVDKVLRDAIGRPALPMAPSELLSAYGLNGTYGKRQYDPSNIVHAGVRVHHHHGHNLSATVSKSRGQAHGENWL